MKDWLFECNIRNEDMISAEDLRTRLKMNSMMKYLQDKRYNESDNQKKLSLGSQQGFS